MQFRDVDPHDDRRRCGMMTINGIKVTKAFNINDKEQEFTRQILDGIKTVETRERHTLDSLIGMTVAIVRTGRGKAVIVGTCRIAGSIEYRTESEFTSAFGAHRVATGSKFDFRHSKTGMKVGYMLADVVELDRPMPCGSRGIVIRNI